MHSAIDRARHRPYKIAMRRRPRLAVFVLLPLLLLAAGYTAYWFYVASLVRASIGEWAAARRAEGVTVGWDSYAIGGFPGAVRVTIESPVYGESTADPGYEARGKRLIGEAWPWAPRRWRVSAPDGLRLVVQPGPERSALRVEAARAQGTVAPQKRAAPATPSGTAIAFTAEQITIRADVTATLAHAAIDATLPDRAVADHRETWFSSTIAGDGLVLPAGIPPLGDTIAHFAGGIAVKGAIPPGPRRQALAAWRDDGGTVELQNLALDWGKLAMAAEGTLSLDAAMQPIGALSTRISGFNEIVDALTTAGTLKAGDAQLAKIALGLLAKPDAEGRTGLAAPLTLQNGSLYIGPARLARLPRFTWE